MKITKEHSLFNGVTKDDILKFLEEHPENLDCPVLPCLCHHWKLRLRSGHLLAYLMILGGCTSSSRTRRRLWKIEF